MYLQLTDVTVEVNILPVGYLVKGFEEDWVVYRQGELYVT